MTEWNQRDHAWSQEEFDRSNEDEWIQETKDNYPGYAFVQKSLAETAENLGMRSYLQTEEFDDDKEEKKAAAHKSVQEEYRQIAWTPDQYDRSNEKAWRKATWEETGYKPERFFDPSPAPTAAGAPAGDKMSDTLLQQGEAETQVPTSLNQQKSKYFRVETKSIIEPYVVRDHSWTLP